MRIFFGCSLGEAAQTSIADTPMSNQMVTVPARWSFPGPALVARRLLCELAHVGQALLARGGRPALDVGRLLAQVDGRRRGHADPVAQDRVGLLGDLRLHVGRLVQALRAALDQRLGDLELGPRPGRPAVGVVEVLQRLLPRLVDVPLAGEVVRQRGDVLGPREAPGGLQAPARVRMALPQDLAGAAVGRLLGGGETRPLLLVLLFQDGPASCASA